MELVYSRKIAISKYRRSMKLYCYGSRSLGLYIKIC